MTTTRKYWPIDLQLFTTGENLLDDPGGGGDDLGLGNLDDLFAAEDARLAAEAADKKGSAPAGDIDAVREANKALTRQISDLMGTVDELKTKVATRPTYDMTVEQRPPQPPQPTDEQTAAMRQRIAKELSEQSLTDPGGALLRVYEAARADARAEMEALLKKNLQPVATGTVQVDIDSYKRDRLTDAEVASAFDAIVTPEVAASMANLTPQQRRQQLDFITDAAYGRVRRQRESNNGRAHDPPSVTGGTSAPGGTPVQTTYKGKELNAVQREILRSCRESGMNDQKRIKAMLDDAAEG